MSPDEMKQSAALAAVQHLPGAGVLGLGTGSTTRWFIEAVGELVRSGRRFSGVPTSSASRSLAQRCGIPLLDDAGPWQLEVCVDGADEVDEALNLIKGGGGAHTREKIVNHAAKRNVIIVDESKLVARLGATRPVPLEVLTFGYETTLGALAAHGRPELRRNGDGPFRTDSGNYLIDLFTGPITDARELDQALHGLPGVVETGLFIGRADVVIVASPSGIRELGRRVR